VAPALATQSASDLNHGSQPSAAEKRAPEPVRPPSRDMANFTPIGTPPAAPAASPWLAKFLAADAASDAALKSGASQARPAAKGAPFDPFDAVGAGFGPPPTSAAASAPTSHAETITVLLLFGLVLGPPFALLLAGVSMMWVVRGFRRDPA
jgi:hypothetical protein